MNETNRLKYCSLTTVDTSMKVFVLPVMLGMCEQGYKVTIGCAMSDEFKQQIPNEIEYINLELKRGFHLKQTVKSIGTMYHFFKKNKFVAVEYATENVSLPASISAWLAGVPVRIYNHWGILFVAHVGLQRFMAKSIEKMIALFSTDIRQVSRLNANLCVKHHLYPSRKVKVLGKGGTVGVDVSLFNVKLRQKYCEEIREKYEIPVESFVFGYVGRIQSHKGINELIDAFRRLEQVHSNIRLLLVGAIENSNPISPENIEWAQNSPQVIFTGQITEVYKYFASFDVLVHPTYHEGFGMVLQEAAAMQTPIITTNIIGPGEFIINQYDGLLVEPKDADSLYLAMKNLMENTEEGKVYAERAYQNLIENFERNVMVKRIIEDRNNIIKRRLHQDVKIDVTDCR